MDFRLKIFMKNGVKFDTTVNLEGFNKIMSLWKSYSVIRRGVTVLEILSPDKKEDDLYIDIREVCFVSRKEIIGC
jgi:hypothetical protein